MELKTAIEILEYHQEWRLGKKEDMIHEPKKLTEALDVILSEIKKEYDWFEIKTQGNPKDIKGVGLQPRYYVVLNGVVFDDDIKELLSKNYNCVYIANLFNVNRKTINDIKLGKTWK